MLFVPNFIISNVVISLIIIIVFTLYLYFKWSFTYWSRRGVIAPSCNFPLGNLNDVALGRVSLHEMFKKSYANIKSKGVKFFGYYFLHQPVLVVLDIELIKSILVKDFAHFTDHGLFEKKEYDHFGGHLIALKGAEWKKMREKLSPLFTGGKVKLMFPTIENCSIQLGSLLDQIAEKSGKFDLKDVVGRYTMDIIASVAFGIEINSLKKPNSDFEKYTKRAIGQGDTISKLRLAIQSLMPDLIKRFKMTFFAPEVSRFFLDIVQSTINYREENNIVRKDFMQLMIQLKNNINISDKDDDCFNLQVNSNKNVINRKDLHSLSIEDVAAQTMLFLVAGYDTSSITITFCMYELAFHQNIQDRLRDEIKTVLNKHDGKLTYNAIMEMTYMDKCLKETLRKYPVVPYLFRRCTKTFQVPNSDSTIEKDMLVFIPINDIHYDPEYYPSPEKFDPERFSSENLSRINTFTWLPFGEGPRICIGARLAMIQMKVGLTTFLRDFRYTLDAKTTYPLKIDRKSFMLAAERDILLNVERVIA